MTVLNWRLKKGLPFITLTMVIVGERGWGGYNNPEITFFSTNFDFKKKLI